MGRHRAHRAAPVDLFVLALARTVAVLALTAVLLSIARPH